jgi:hypothetical protein
LKTKAAQVGQFTSCLKVADSLWAKYIEETITNNTNVVIEFGNKYYIDKYYIDSII